jgi:hypothetical protein
MVWICGWMDGMGCRIWWKRRYECPTVNEIRDGYQHGFTIIRKDHYHELIV